MAKQNKEAVIFKRTYAVLDSNGKIALMFDAKEKAVDMLRFNSHLYSKVVLIKMVLEEVIA